MAQISLDFGTSNSSVAYFNGRSPEIIKIDGDELMPSVVTIANGVVEVGQDAVELGRKFPDYCFRHFKRQLGDMWNPDEDVGSQLCEGKDEAGKLNGMTHFKGPNGTTYAPEELASFCLGKMIDAAEAKLRTKITRAVLSYPATFTTQQKEALKRAGYAAGLETVELIDEPTAAAVAYGYDFKKVRRIAVLDVGGGTTDVSFIVTGGGDVKSLATNGSPLVGGADWDRAIGEYVVNRWRQSAHGSDINIRDQARALVLQEAEQTKRRLTRRKESEFRVEDIDINPATGVSQHVIYSIDRDTMDKITSSYLRSIEAACQRAVDEAKEKDPKFSIRDLDDVILIGGMTRVQSIQQLAREFFGQEPKDTVDPEIAVALGGAVRAAVLDGRKGGLTLSQITGHTFSLEVHNAVEDVAMVLIPKGTSYPCKLPRPLFLTNRDAGQQRLSIRLLEGDEGKASACAVLWSAEIEIEAGEPRTAREEVVFEIDESGNPRMSCAGLTYGEAA